MSLDHLCRYPILNAEKVDDRQLIFAFAPMILRPVSESQVIELPQQLDVEVFTQTAIAECAVGPAPKVRGASLRA